MNITLANGMLGINALVPKTLNKTRGLMGNFNGDPNDDYIPRDSKTPLASNSTEQQIFFDFGKTCKLFCLLYILNGVYLNSFSLSSRRHVFCFCDDALIEIWSHYAN